VKKLKREIVNSTIRERRDETLIDRRLTLSGAVSRNQRLHEVSIEIFQRVARRLSQSTGALSQFRPDEGQPDVVCHAHFRAQPCGWAARMALKIFVYVFFYCSGNLFDCK